MMWQSNKPIIGVVGFNVFTLLVFITAPVKWNTPNVAELCVLVLLCQLLLLAGFRLGRAVRPATPLTETPLFFQGATLVNGLFAIYVLTFPITYAYRMGFAPFDIAGMLSRLVVGLRDPHFAYVSALEKGGGSPIPWSVYFAVSIFNQSFFAAGFLYWRHLSLPKKVGFAIFLALELFYWVGIATSFGIIALATTFGMSTMFWAPRVGRPAVRTILASVVLAVLLLGGTVAYFSYNLYRRSNVAEIDVEQFEIAQAPIIPGHPTLALVPEPLRRTYVMAVSYLAQGYYHTCFAFDLDFRSTGFLGNNPGLINLAQAFGVDVWDDTYMHRLQSKGIDEFGVWHSAYTWFACDVSFYGVPVLLFLLACLFGSAWTQGMRGDYLSRLVFVMFGNVLLFLFANNTYLASVFYSFIFVVPLWFFTRLARVARLAPIGRRPRVACAGSGSPNSDNRMP